MSGIPTTFWSQPIRYLRWASHEKPAIFWSIILGGMGPVILVAGRPFREWVGDEIPKAVPHSYPGKSLRTHCGVEARAVFQSVGRRVEEVE